MAVARYYDHDLGEWVLLAAGRDGESGASSWDDISGKPSVYPPELHTHAEYATTTTVTSVSSRVTTLENSQPIIVSSLPASPLPGRIYLVTG